MYQKDPGLERTLRRGDCVLQATVIDGPGTPIIVTPGALGLRAVSEAQLAPVIGHRKLVLLEVRGHGSSTCRHPQHYSWRSLTDDLLGWIDELAIERCSLMGTSLGSMVSLAAAVQRPDLVESIVITNAVFVGDDVVTEPTHELALRALASCFLNEPTPTAAGVLEGLSALGVGDPALFSQVLALHSDLESIAAYFGLEDRGELGFTSVALKQLEVPALIVGGRDPVHPAEVSRTLAELLPQSHLVEIEHLDPAAAMTTTAIEIATFLLDDGAQS